MRDFLLVFVGGGLGCGARYALSSALGRWAARHELATFPWGTFAVNVIGSFALGWLLQSGGEGGPSPTLRLLVGTGALGGFTTYSSFNAETLLLVQDGHGGLAALNVAATLAVCVAAGLAGMAVARMV